MCFALFSTYAAHKINDINWHSHYNFLFLTQNIAAELTSFWKPPDIRAWHPFCVELGGLRTTEWGSPCAVSWLLLRWVADAEGLLCRAGFFNDDQARCAACMW